MASNLPYLQRLYLEEVEESAVNLNTNYVNIVELVEVVDSNGDPWAPVPPDDPLSIASGQGANWVSTDFVQGSDVTAKTAAYIGGVEPVTYRARFRTKVLPTDSSWTDGPWTTVPNEKVILTTQLTSTTGSIVFQSQATDSSDPPVHLNSNTGTKTVPYPTLTAGTPTIQGQPAVGNTLCCLEPTPSGGAAPYVYTYMWTNAATNAVVFENKFLQDCLLLDATDEGITYYCQVTITSADKQTVNVATANIGPIVSN
jgi:hypothetical protein